MMRRHPLKIEMVLPSLARAGMEVMAMRLTRALAGRGYDIGVTCLESSGELADELIADGHRVTIVPAPGLWSNLRAPALEAWFGTHRVDVVHVHSGAWLKTARAARRAGVSCVVHTVHGLLDREPWHGAAQKRWAARYTNRIAAVSEPLRRHLIDDVRLDPAKVSVIPNGLDTAHFAPGAPSGIVRAALHIADGTLVLGTVARLSPVKNQRLLLDAFAIVHHRMPDAHLVIVGEGPLRAALEEQIRALGLDGVAHLFGAVSDVAPVCRELDLFVLPSIAEGTSMSILEAMSSGVCVVATAVGGTPDLLAHGRCGVLVPPNDPVALAAAMTDTLLDQDRRRRLAAAAREHAIARYSEAAMLRAYEALYHGRAPDGGETSEPLTASDVCVG
jgi:glycosyltransferase involved in cell wall biosynthesis